MDKFEDFVLKLAYDGPYVVVSDNRQHCYSAFLKWLIKEKYVIWGLKRTASGNFHEFEMWQDEYTIVHDVGQFSGMLNAQYDQLPGLHVETSDIVHVDNIEDVVFSEWSQPFERGSGCEDERKVWAFRNELIGKGDTKNCCYEFTLASIFPQSIVKMGVKERKNWILRKQIYAIVAKRDEYDVKSN